MSIFDKLSNEAKVALAQINWKALDIIKEIEYFEKKLKNIDNMSLMARAVITSNATMFREHISAIKAIEAKIKSLEANLEEIKKEQEEKREAEKQQPPKPFEYPEGRVTPLPPVDLKDIDFADDVLPLINVANSLDKKGYYRAAEVVDDMAEQKIEKLKDPNRQWVKSIRVRLAQDISKSKKTIK